MLRKAFRMSVHDGQEDEYEQRHSPIPRELAAVLKEHGAHNYSIFLDPVDRSLFAYVEVEDEERWEAISRTAACRRWWAAMREVMPSNDDDSPVSVPLREVFHLD